MECSDGDCIWIDVEGLLKKMGGALSKKQIDHENDLRIGHYRTVSKKQRYHENDIGIGHYRTEGGHSSTRRVQSIPGVIGDYLAGVQSSPGAMGDYTSAIGDYLTGI